MTHDPRAAEKLEILRALDQRLTEVFNRWNLSKPESRSAFSAERLIPLSKPYGGGSPFDSGGALGPGDIPGVKLLTRWYEKSGEPNQGHHPSIDNRQWSAATIRVEKFLDDSLSENQILHRSGDAPWLIATTPGGKPLLSDVPLHLDPKHKNREGLLPHKTEWSQSLFLACRFKEKSLFTWVNKKHPEWLDDDGEMVPLSQLGQETELLPEEQMERDYILNEPPSVSLVVQLAIPPEFH